MTAAPDSAPPLPARAGDPPSARHRVHGSMTRRERIRVGGPGGFVLALHLTGRGTLVGVVARRHLGSAARPSTPATSPRSATPPAS
ncbi:hypothetical protein ABZV75_29290 [Streptomyces flaveolus]|uniref:hypothetical protein n=1 Tax=Streptomyces flaveolus TaxID=67297 RepID=UPI0033B033B3